MLMLIVILLFMAAQGSVIFLTARWVFQLKNLSHWSGKIIAMVISCIAWIVFTIMGYSLLGGEGGIMDGFGFVLVLCFLAMISSFVYLLIWLFTPSPAAADPEEEFMIEPRA